jgi:hypothetical protein
MAYAESDSFKEGDIIEVLDPVSKKLLGVGKALQSRGHTGFAHFDILTHRGNTESLNLNHVIVRVIYSEPSEEQLTSNRIEKIIGAAFADTDLKELPEGTLDRVRAVARNVFDLASTLTRAEK